MKGGEGRLVYQGCFHYILVWWVKELGRGYFEMTQRRSHFD
jgi:hypothetical protein